MQTTTRRPSLRWRLFLAGAGAVGLATIIGAWWLWRPNELDTSVDPGDAWSGREGGIGRTEAPAETVTESENQAPLWVVVDEVAGGNAPPYPDEWSAEGRVLVQIADLAATASSWRVGDRLTLPLPQLGQTYDAVIEEIDEAVGARALLGKITGEDGRRRRYVVTVGPTSLFAFLDTPVGPYELIAETGYGWLLPSSSMMAGFDTTTPDYILLPDRQD